MENIREEVSAWAKDNGIDDGWCWCMGLEMPGKFGDFRGGRGGFGLRPGLNPGPSSTSSPSVQE